MKKSLSPRSQFYATARHPAPQEDADELDCWAPNLSFSLTSRTKPAPTATSTVKGNKRKTAQSIQTPSASPRHQPIPVASTSTHKFPREDKRSEWEERRMRKNQDEVALQRAYRDQQSAREESERKRLSNSSRPNPEPIQSPRQERSIRRSLGKQKAMEEEIPGRSTGKRRRTSEKEEKVP